MDLKYKAFVKASLYILSMLVPNWRNFTTFLHHSINFSDSYCFCCHFLLFLVVFFSFPIISSKAVVNQSHQSGTLPMEPSRTLRKLEFREWKTDRHTRRYKIREGYRIDQAWSGKNQFRGNTEYKCQSRAIPKLILMHFALSLVLCGILGQSKTFYLSTSYLII